MPNSVREVKPSLTQQLPGSLECTLSAPAAGAATATAASATCINHLCIVGCLQVALRGPTAGAATTAATTASIHHLDAIGGLEGTLGGPAARAATTAATTPSTSACSAFRGSQGHCNGIGGGATQRQHTKAGGGCPATRRPRAGDRQAVSLPVASYVHHVIVHVMRMIRLAKLP